MYVVILCAKLLSLAFRILVFLKTVVRLNFKREYSSLLHVCIYIYLIGVFFRSILVGNLKFDIAHMKTEIVNTALKLNSLCVMLCCAHTNCYMYMQDWICEICCKAGQGLKFEQC